MRDCGVEGEKMKEMVGVVGILVQGITRVKGGGRRRVIDCIMAIDGMEVRSTVTGTLLTIPSTAPSIPIPLLILRCVATALPHVFLTRLAVASSRHTNPTSIRACDKNNCIEGGKVSRVVGDGEADLDQVA